jgi:hypothetical protein
VIGSIDPATMHERPDGLYVEGQLDLEDSEVAREAWRSVKRNRIGLSFRYLVVDQHEADGLKVLDALDVFEITLTPIPANADGVDEKELREWERGCAEDMRKSRPIQVKVFECDRTPTPTARPRRGLRPLSSSCATRRTFRPAI